MSLQPTAGGGKKFLYTSPVNSQSSGNDQLSFNSNSPSLHSTKKLPMDLNNVWSIRNVGLTVRNTSAGQTRSDLNKNVPTCFYSRHGGLNGQNGLSKNVGNTVSPTGVQWVSSGHSLNQTSKLRNSQETPPSSSSARKKQSYSPFDSDFNDF